MNAQRVIRMPDAGCRRAAGAALGLLILAASAHADWPIFRGDPALTGVAAGELPATLALRWSFKTGGEVKSSPVMAAGVVYAGSGDGKLYALDAATGRPRWTFAADAGIEAPPLIAGGRVFVGSQGGVLYALGAADGASNWAYRTEGKMTGSANLLAAAAGRPDLVVAGSYDFKLHAVTAATGRAAWTFETSNFLNGAPSVSSNGIVFGGCDGLVHVLAADGKPVREIEAGAYIPGSIAVADGTAYVGHYGNELLAVDLVRGAVRWRYGRADDGEPFFASPAVTAAAVLAGSRDGKLHAVRRSDGRALWTFAARGAIDSAPAVCGGSVLFGSNDGRLYRVALDTGRLLWSYDVGAPVTTAPAVGGGLVVVGAEDGSIHAFGAAPR